jgi:hypothetical protein
VHLLGNFFEKLNYYLLSIDILLLSVTSMFAVAETYQFKAPISPVIEESVFTSSAPAVAALIETGPRGNIALRGTNGLTSSSYSAKTTYRSKYAADRAFNGLDSYKRVINSEYDILDLNGQWVSNSTTSNEWIQVDFGQEVNITGCAIHMVGEVKGDVRDTIVQISNDGVNWVNHREASFSDQVGWKSITLGVAVVTRFFRLAVVNNNGGTFVEVGELEIYQN